MKIEKLQTGANHALSDSGTAHFRVWAPKCKKVKLVMPDRSVEMKKDSEGYFDATTRVSSAQRYRFLPNTVNFQTEGLPDPVSRFQINGVHGNSVLVDPKSFEWEDKNWKGISQEDLIIYEMHTGTFTEEGTFEAAIKKIPELKNLGITCIELMPVAQFPGRFGWGYDGVNLFAPQNSYGGPQGLKMFVNECHKNNIAVCLDVVYNHLGPEGNYLDSFGSYFSKKYETPWGVALNFDGPDSKPVRDYIISNALYWIAEYHIDALRLDAVDHIKDKSQKHVLTELREETEKLANMLDRKVIVIAESFSNNPGILKHTENGQKSYADATWSPNFQQSLYATLGREQTGWYKDFHGFRDLVKAFRDVFVFDGERVSKYHSAIAKKPVSYGYPVNGISRNHFVTYSQSHDTVGNHPLGHRLSHFLSFESLKLTAAVSLLSPSIPQLFMGEEFGAKTPFLFFTDYSDEGSKKNAFKGRRKELKEFGWKDWANTPEPNQTETFKRSKLNWDELANDQNKFLLELYKDLIKIRKDFLIPEIYNKNNITISHLPEAKCIGIEYALKEKKKLGIVHSFADCAQIINSPFNERSFHVVLDTENTKYGGQAKPNDRPYFERITMQPNSSLIGWVK